MAIVVYKSGQGYYTRMLSFIASMTLVACLALWIWNHLGGIDNEKTMMTARVCVMVGICLVFGVLSWYLFNKPSVVDFMIATEAEMRKVNWPTRREITVSTVVVIVGTIVMALFLLVVDVVSLLFFKLIGVLA